MAAILIAGCAWSMPLADSAEAELSPEQALEASKAYDNVGMVASDDHSTEHRMKDTPERTSFWQVGKKFRFQATWKLASDAYPYPYTRKVRVNIVLKGNGTRACITRRHNKNVNTDPPDLPWVARYYFNPPVLDWLPCT